MQESPSRFLMLTLLGVVVLLGAGLVWAHYAHNNSTPATANNTTSPSAVAQASTTPTASATATTTPAATPAATASTAAPSSADFTNLNASLQSVDTLLSQADSSMTTANNAPADSDTTP